MSNKGRVPLEQKLGVERFKALSEKMSIEEIAELVCEHEVGNENKRKCKACRRAIYRAKERLAALNKKDKTFEPIDDFAEIPEIAALITHCKAKGIKYASIIANLFRMWNWIRTSGNAALIETQRPILWNKEHIEYILIKVDEAQISRYGWIQALRQLYSNTNRLDMLKIDLLKARRRDLRSPKGAKRPRDRFTMTEFEQILNLSNEEQKTDLMLHVTLRSREGSDERNGSLLGLKWENINWTDTFYGFPTVTATVFEPKTGGGTLWEHIPIDFWFNDLSERLKKRLATQTNPYIVNMTYQEYLDFWAIISGAMGDKFEPHDCRRSPSGWLRDLALSDLAIGQYDARTGKATGYAGVGWENAEIFFQRYGKMNPLAIFNKEKLELPAFINGLVRKVVKQ